MIVGNPTKEGRLASPVPARTNAGRAAIVEPSRAPADPRCGPALPERAVAYLGDPLAVGGAGPLLAQKSAVDAIMAVRPVDFIRYYVDSGRSDGPVSPGPALAAMVRDAAAGSFDCVFVRTPEDLSPDPAIASGTIAALGLVGVRVLDAGGHVVSWTQPLLALVEEAA